jgi:hypothetical protein
MFKQTYVHPVSQQRYGDWTWCRRCECVHRTAQWFANHWFCPHPACNGTASDSSCWHHRNEAPCDINPWYPVVPVEGQRYAAARTVTEENPTLRHSAQTLIWVLRIAQRAKFGLQERIGQVALAASQAMEVHRLQRRGPRSPRVAARRLGVPERWHRVADQNRNLDARGTR